MVTQRAFNPSVSSSNLDGPTKLILAFVQWIGQEPSKFLMGVRFPHAGPE